MGYVVRMPQLGMTMEEGVVVEWTVDEGEEFSDGDVIAVVESEKTTNDVEAREDGQILERFVDLNQSVEPGDPIAYVGEEGESVPDDVDVEAPVTGTDGETAAGGAPTGEAAPATASDSGAGGMTTGRGGDATATSDDAKVSPRARAYARENDIDESLLGDLQGSGPDGAVVEQDVVDAADDLQARARTEPAAVGRAGDRAGTPVSVSGRGIYETRGETGLRRTIAERMTASAAVPQVTLNRRVAVDALLAVKDRLATDRGLELSLTDFLLAAVVEALGEHPAFNAVYEDDTHKLAANVNLGVAVDIEGGLVTPVIMGADQRTTAELREERRRLVSLVQSGEYTMDDLTDGTFTVTNLGHFGVESFDPLLNPPQVAILGVGDVRSRYDPETEESVRELGLSLTFDHRAVDGADAARFLGTLADALGHPLRLVSFGRDREAAGPFEETGAGPDGHRIATAESGGDLQATVRSRRFEWRADEPEDVGGDDTAPSPVEQFVGSLSSCLTLMIGHVAEQRDVEVEDVTVTAQAHPQEGRIERIEVDVRVTADAPEEDVERLVEMAERACYVNQVIDSDVERDVDVTIETP